MKGIGIEQYGDLDQVKVLEIDIPKPLPHEVQIQVAYAGVNPVDWKICTGMFKSRMPYQFPLILGWDAAGTITEVGKDVTKFRKGDKVYAYIRSNIVKNGSFTEYVCFDAKHVARQPTNLTFAEAASIPLACLTAWQALTESAQLKKGQTVLIHAGAGGVGSFAIQIAKKYLQAKVITTAREVNHRYVKQLGADVAIDYTKQSLADLPAVDVVLDCIGGKTLEESYSIVKPGGHLVSICAEPNQDIAHKQHIHASFVFVRPDGQQLEQIAKLFENNTFEVPHLEEFPLVQAKEALEKQRTGHVQGKIVLKVR